MTISILADATGHHVWATLQVIDACLALSPEGLETSVPGTYGSILDTIRHLVGADASYLYALTGGRTPQIDENHMDLAALRRSMASHETDWASVVEVANDPTVDVVRLREDDTASHAPLGIRLAQALHHGTDHRSQVCTALSSLGLEPPAIDVWDYGTLDGRVFVTPSSSR